MTDTICLDNRFSTTKLLIDDEPKIKANPDDKFEAMLFLPEDEERQGEGGLRTKGYFKESYTHKPLMSILTVVYNGETCLEETIQSVVNQTYDNIEYIIIDGGSTDGTLQIIKKYENQIDYWVSEQDHGIYDAMNKGVRLITGDFVNFLNADDVIYANDAISNIVNHIKHTDNIYFNRAQVVSDTVSWIYPSMDTTDVKKWLKWNLPNHQTMFFPKCFYKKHLYDTRLKITADDDYKLFALKNQNIEFIDLKYIKFKRGGVSSDHKSLSLLKQRVKESFLRNFKHKRWMRFFIDPFKLLLMFLVNVLFGEHYFLHFIKMIVKIKR